MKSFLIVDRDRGLVEAVQRCLIRRGCEVAAASNGLQCLEALRAFAPSVLVLDPGILWGGGEGVLDWLTYEKPMTPLTIVILESDDGCHISEQLLPLIGYHLHRPKKWEDLLPLIDRLESIVDELESTVDDSPKETVIASESVEPIVPC